MKLRLAVVGALTLVAGLLVPSAALADTAPPDRITWGTAPANEDGPDERISFRVELEPGQSHEDHLAVINHSDRELAFALMASDGVITEAGTFDLLTGDAQPTGTGAWIELPEEVTVAAGDIAVVPFALDVPDDALPGDHPGGIVVTVASVPGDPAVTLDAGTGARIHLRVAGEVAPSIALTDVQATYHGTWNPLEPGVLDVEWTVVNDGNVRLGTSQVLDVVGALGLDAGVVRQDVGAQREVLPGQSVTLRTSVEAWPLGTLTAEVSAATAVVGEDVVDAALPTAVGTATAIAVPWPHLVLLGALVGLVVTAVVRRRRRRHRQFTQAAATVQEEALAES